MPNDEIGDLLTEIVKLQRKVSGLAHVAQHLFVLASSNQRFTEEQETAFKEILSYWNRYREMRVKLF
jgi:hypothetical protein